MTAKRLRDQAIHYIAVGIKHPKLRVEVYLKDRDIEFYHDLSDQRSHYIDFYFKGWGSKAKYASGLYTVFRDGSDHNGAILGRCSFPKAEDIKNINIRYSEINSYKEVVIEVNNLIFKIKK